MKKLFPAVIILILLDFQISFSQQVDFAYGYSGALNRHYASINDVELTGDSSLLLTGTSWYHNGIEEYFIIKADLDGNIHKIIRDDSTSMGYGEGQIIKELSNGNYLMIEFSSLQGHSSFPKLMFYDSTGNFLFQKTPYIPPDVTVPIDSVFMPSGLVEIQSRLYLIGQVFSASSASYSGIFLKTDLDGNLLQLNWLPDLWPARYHGGIITSHENIMVGGRSIDSVSANNKPKLACIDTSGMIEWQQTYNIGSTLSEVDEICEVPGGYLLAVSDASTLIKVDTAGYLIWAEPQSLFWNEQMQLNYSENYLTTGYSGTVKWCDTLGQLIGSYSVGVSSLEATETFILNDKIYITGRAYIGSGYEGYLVRISDSLLTSISEERHPNSKIYPNPIYAGTRLYFSISPEKITSVTLHDGDGKLLRPSMVSKANTNPFIDIPESLQAGTYLITINYALTKFVYRLVVIN